MIFMTPPVASRPLAYAAPVSENMPQGRVTLDAERVSYDDEGGKASAEGSAVLTYEEAVIRADRIDYDAVSQKVKASAEPGGSVSMEGLGRKVSAETLEYDLNTRDGVLNGVKSDLPIGSSAILYVKGGGMQFMPYELALERGLVNAGKAERNAPAYAGFAENVSATTCALEHPHYHIETKNMIFIPGRQVTAKKPRLYLGGKYIFTYPLDYVVLINRRALKHSIIPYVQNSEKKGTGVGVSGGFEWGTGSLNLGVSAWGKTGAEWMAEADQSAGGGFSVRGGVKYTWHEAWDEKKYNPSAGLYYERDGWEAALRFAWSDYVDIQKDSSHEYMGRLNYTPEFTVLTPWIKDTASNLSWFRLGVSAGKYKESTPLVTGEPVFRYGAGIQNYFEHPFSGAVTFFSNLSYNAWFYDQDSLSQEVLNGIAGFRYNFGAVELASGYERRYVWGESPMLWDSESEIERLHQKIRFPAGKEFYLALRGSYDMNESKMEGIHYALQWITDCMKVELSYYDDRTSGSDNNISLSLSLLAFPDTPASFGQREYYDPFQIPEGINLKK